MLVNLNLGRINFLDKTFVIYKTYFLITVTQNIHKGIFCDPFYSLEILLASTCLVLFLYHEI